MGGGGLGAGELPPGSFGAPSPKGGGTGHGLDEDGSREIGADDPVGLIDDFGNFQINRHAAQAIGIDWT